MRRYFSMDRMPCALRNIMRNPRTTCLGVLVILLAQWSTTQASAGYDRTDRRRDMTPRMPAVPTGRPSQAQLRQLWAYLGDPDAENGFQAVRVLAAHPAQTLPFLRER